MLQNQSVKNMVHLYYSRLDFANALVLFRHQTIAQINDAQSASFLLLSRGDTSIIQLFVNIWPVVA